MSNIKNQEQQAKKGNEAKKQVLAKNLRENLKRRKTIKTPKVSKNSGQ